MLEGWGRFVHRRRWAVLGASLAMLALSGVLLAQGGDLGNPDTIPSTESGRASQLLSTELPRPTGVPTGASFTLVFRSETLAVADPAYRQAVTDALVPLRGDPRVTSIRTYYDAPTPSLLSRDDNGEFQRRWETIQTGFVDEPRQTVEQADELVAHVMKRLAEGFASERERLEGQWGRGEDVSTEDLRIALQRYRAFFQRLLQA